LRALIFQPDLREMNNRSLAAAPNVVHCRRIIDQLRKEDLVTAKSFPGGGS
jgi:hypothetical protein